MAYDIITVWLVFFFYFFFFFANCIHAGCIVSAVGAVMRHKPGKIVEIYMCA